jgi:hypothetical protein
MMDIPRFALEDGSHDMGCRPTETFDLEKETCSLLVMG